LHLVISFISRFRNGISIRDVRLPLKKFLLTGNAERMEVVVYVYFEGS
jgi:hypothetical protein